MLNYSIIIPHKDIPDLLQRCLDSIPVRDDVQVIVVDDNSDPRKVDFANFPKWGGKCYEYYITKKGKGAGYARNIGLEHAQGRWIVFADADDYFAEGFNALLNETVDAVEDMVFFDYINVLSEDITKLVNDRMWYSRSMMKCRNGDISKQSMKISIPVVWCKIMKRELIEKKQMRFSETRWSNDVFFVAQVNCYSKTEKVRETIGYVLTQRDGSLSHNGIKSTRELKVRLQESLKSERLYMRNRLRAKGSLTSPYLKWVYDEKGFWWCVWFCVINVFDWPVLKSMMHYLAKMLKEKQRIGLNPNGTANSRLKT